MSIKAFTVVYNTPKLLMDSVGSFRKYYPDIPLLIMNNSDPDNACTDLILELVQRDAKITAVHYEKNQGHGYAFNDAMNILESDYVYYFDSDTIMFKGGAIEQMVGIMDDNIYGAGKIIYTDMGGRGIPRDYDGEKLRYLYLVVGMLNRKMYHKFHHWTKFGLIAYKAMVDIHDNGDPENMLKEFPIMSYVRHLSGGTRSKFGDCEDIVEGFRGRKADMTSELD